MTNQLPPGPSREVAAHHEAAHVVAALRSGGVRGIDSVYIAKGSTPERGWHGWTMFADSDGVIWENLALTMTEVARDAEAVMLAAGRCGHEHLVGNGLEAATSDFWCKLDEEPLRILRWCIINASAEANGEDLNAAIVDGEAWLLAIRQSARALRPYAAPPAITVSAGPFFSHSIGFNRATAARMSAIVGAERLRPSVVEGSCPSRTANGVASRTSAHFCHFCQRPACRSHESRPRAYFGPAQAPSGRTQPLFDALSA